MRLLSFVLMSGLAGCISGVALAASPPKTPTAPADPATPEAPGDEAPGNDAGGNDAGGNEAGGNEAAGGNSDLITFADPDVILDIAKGYGSANLEKDSDGNPQIAGRLEGVKYWVYFYGCTNGANCRSIQFSTGYTDPFTAAKANEWNYQYRYVKAYESKGSNFRMDVDFQGGISHDNLDAQFDTWSGFIPTIKDFVSGK
jgi:hypothetical protein